VTNLRLPGQYDERLFAAAGISGLQGPYYNWNRWYLPGVGRYLELDPLAVEGGFNTPSGVDWYSYAGGNPVRFIDPNGWKIRSSITQGPDQFPATTCSGQPGAACLAAGFTITACTCDCGKCKFDANVSAKMWREFVNRRVMGLRSCDSPGKTLAQHENLHITDYRGAFAGNKLDSLYQSEGFDSMAECERQRQGFAAWLESYRDGVLDKSGAAHDDPSCR
jgi:RHS repeat-associated protein